MVVASRRKEAAIPEVAKGLQVALWTWSGVAPWRQETQYRFDPRLMLVGTICWVVVSKDKYEFLSPLVHIVFDVVGFYFDSKPVNLPAFSVPLWAPL
jgi:hypothetical protein